MHFVMEKLIGLVTTPFTAPNRLGWKLLSLAKSRLILAATLGIVSSPDSSWCHQPAGAVFRAFPFSSESVPTIDGDLSDWAHVGPGYAIETEAFRDLVGDAQVDDGDFSVALWVGWNEEINRLFVAARVSDDIHQIDREPGTAVERIFLDDNMHVFLDSDHSGGQFADFSDASAEDQLRLNGAEASHFVIAGPPPDEDFFINFSAAGWYSLPDSPFSQAAFMLEGSIGAQAVMSYELMLAPFDHVNMTADFLSQPHHLTAGEVLGFNVEFDDYDSRSELFDAKWSLSGGHNAYKLADRFTDLVLVSPDEEKTTVVKDRSWGRIKASFGE